MSERNREQLEQMEKAELIELVLQLSEEVNRLSAKIQEWRDQLNKNSQNSGKPPSSDGLNPPRKSKSLREKTDRRSGGQKGHAGHTLKQVDKPDEVEVHPVTWRGHGQADLRPVASASDERRQVFDIPPVELRVIEQHQILTTQNLAGLFDVLDLKTALADQLEGLAQTCFKWVCQQHQITVRDWHARLVMLKNTAYAWRQMIFYLSLLPDVQVQSFLIWMEDYFDQQNPDFQQRFRPVLQGLLLAVEGDEDFEAIKPHRFLGWSQTKHWPLDEVYASEDEIPF